jgi:hypothetical protein
MIGLIAESPLYPQFAHAGNCSSISVARPSSTANLVTAIMLERNAHRAASSTDSDSAFSASLAIPSLAQVTRVANRPMARPRARR